MNAADILRAEARAYAAKLMYARLAGKPRKVVWRPMALKLIRLARQIERAK